MKKKYIKVAVFALMLSSGICLNAQQINPMTEAVIRGYNEILAENPKDYYTLYDRGAQYFAIGNYDRALSDIEMALEYTPMNDKDYLEAEYSLMAEIYLAQKEYSKAINATNEALKINPSSQNDLYRMGNLFLIQNDGSGALKAFQQLQRENSRSQEAFYGMAKANILIGRNDAAEELINEIENLGKNSFITYCRIGDLYTDMGKTKEASGYYLKAAMMDASSNRPLEALKYLAMKDYPTVIGTIESYQTAAPDNISYPYLKAVLAYDRGDYKLASQTCETLINQLDEENSSVYRMLANARKAMGMVDESLIDINKALALNSENPDILADKADILLAINPAQALETAEKALEMDPDNEFAILTASKASILHGDANKGNLYLNELILINPSNIEALLLRGYLNENLKKDSKASIADYGRAGMVKSENAPDISLAALGKSKAGKKLDADGMIKDAISKGSKDKMALFNIAVYYAQTGNLELAKEYADKAVAAGYSNIYNLKFSKEPLLNLMPIHHLM